MVTVILQRVKGRGYIPRLSTALDSQRHPEHVVMLPRLSYNEIIMVFHVLSAHDHRSLERDS